MQIDNSLALTTNASCKVIDASMSYVVGRRITQHSFFLASLHDEALLSQVWTNVAVVYVVVKITNVYYS